MKVYVVHYTSNEIVGVTATLERATKLAQDHAVQSENEYLEEGEAPTPLTFNFKEDRFTHRGNELVQYYVVARSPEALHHYCIVPEEVLE